MPELDDLVYVNTFHDAQSPEELRLPAGMGMELKKAVEKFVAGITAALREMDQARKDFVAGMNQEAVENDLIITPQST